MKKSVLKKDQNFQQLLDKDAAKTPKQILNPHVKQAPNGVITEEARLLVEKAEEEKDADQLKKKQAEALAAKITAEQNAAGSPERTEGCQ